MDDMLYAIIIIITIIAATMSMELPSWQDIARVHRNDEWRLGAD